MREESIQRVVVLFPGALGDWLLALPALRALRARHSNERLTMVVREPLRTLATAAGVADVTADVDAAATAGLFGASSPPAWLAGRPTVYSWLGAEDADVRRRLARLASRVRFFSVERGPGPVHAAVAYARGIGVRMPPRALAAAARFVPPASAAASAVDVWSAPVLALHPGAGARAKRWDAAGFVQVAEWWRSAGGTTLEVAGPAEAGEPPVLGGTAARDWSLADLAALLARVALYLGNDSGVSHLAAAVGTPGVVLFGPTQPTRWRPAGDRLAVLHARTSGPDGIPLTALPAARVIAACRRRFTLTRGRRDTSVGAEAQQHSGRLRRALK